MKCDVVNKFQPGDLVKYKKTNNQWIGKLGLILEVKRHVDKETYYSMYLIEGKIQDQDEHITRDSEIEFAYDYK